MLSSYLKIALRTFAANKLYTFINVFALSVAMACGIVAYVNFDFSRSFDQSHRNLDALYVIRSVTAADNGDLHVGITPRPLGPALVRDFPQINHMTRIISAWSPLRFEDKVFNEDTYYVEPDFLEMFTFPVIAGTPTALQTNSQIILTKKTAEKYFGEDNAIGKVLTLQSGGQPTRSYVVGAVLEDIASNSSLQFGALLPYRSLEDVDKADADWNAWSNETIVQADDPSVVDAINLKLGEYVEMRKAANPDLALSRMYVTPMSEVSSHTRDLVNDIFKEGMHPAAVVAPSITAILLLITACFNFMNTSLAFSAVRLKEVGIRKVLGSVRSQLVVQFIGENLILCVISLIIAIGLAEIFVPAYESLWPDWDMQLRYAQNWGLFAFLAVLLIGMSIVSGAYPSIYVSRFSPVTILTGRQKFSGKNWLMQTILLFQFTFSAITILTGIVFTSNASFLEEFDLGFDTRETMVIPLQGTGSFETLRNAALSHPDILGVEGARHVVSYNQSTQTARVGSVEQRVAVLQVGHDYLSVMDLNLAKGRMFDKTFRSDQDEAIIVSQKFAREFQWEEPIGQRVQIDSAMYTVIGVVEDFYNRSVWNPIQPSAFLVAKEEEFRYLLVRARPSKLRAVSEYMTEAWRAVAPNVPYEGFYGSDAVRNASEVSSSIRKVFLAVSGAAIAIAAMGLFALSSLIIVKRTKEIGIRKVLGAPVVHIVNLLNRQLALILISSGLIAAVSGLYMIEMFLSSIFAYHVEMQAWHFFAAAGIVLLIGLVTVSSQVYRVATSNPVESLKYE